MIALAVSFSTRKLLIITVCYTVLYALVCIHVTKTDKLKPSLISKPEILSYSLITVHLLLHIQSSKYLNYVAYPGNFIRSLLFSYFTLIDGWYNCAVVAVNDKIARFLNDSNS